MDWLCSTTADGAALLRRSFRDAAGHATLALSFALLSSLTLMPRDLSASTFNAHASLAINLPEPTRWGTDWPFIDEMKRAEVITQGEGVWNTEELHRLDLNDDGWPRSLGVKDGGPVQFNRVSYLLFGGDYKGWDVTPPPAGEFQVFHQGKGTLQYRLGAKRVGSCGDQCDRVQLDPAGMPVISITALDREDPLRNIQVIWPGGICDGDVYTRHRGPSSCHGVYQSFADLKDVMTFHPDFLRDLRSYRALRFMNWQRTNFMPRPLPQPDPVAQLPVVPETPLEPHDETPATSDGTDVGSATDRGEATESAAPTPGSANEYLLLAGATANEVAMAPSVLESADVPLTVDIESPLVETGPPATLGPAPSPLRQWSRRLQAGSAQWINANAGGVPVEVMVELSNLLESDPWFNVHALASDDYVRRFAEFALERLANNRRVYIEFSNEVWNGAFKAGDWAQANADQFWPESTDRYGARMNWFAKRTVEVCGIWKAVWGEQAGRVQCAIGAQAANSWVTEFHLLECPLWRDDPRNPLQGTSCATQLDAVAIAPYFGGYVGAPGNETALTALTVLPDGGVDALLTELTQGGVLPNSPPGGALAEARQWMHAQADVAARHGMALLAYEGGQHLVGTGGLEHQPALTQLFRSVNRAPAMLGLYTDYLNAWRDSGGTMLALYRSTGPTNKWGSWGLSERLTQRAAPKRTAVLNFNAVNACWWEGCGVGPVPESRDSDGDGIVDWVDNCQRAFNPDQRDTDGDGFGNACDADLDNSGFVDLEDFKRFKASVATNDPNADFNGDGRVDLNDLVIFTQLFLNRPGPAGRP